MPYVNGYHDGRTAVMNVAIIDAAGYVEHKQSENPVLTGVSPYRALIDTGATSTMITTKVVRELKLQPVSALLIQGVVGKSYLPSYLFNVAFFPTPYSTTDVNKIQVCTKVINGSELTGDVAFDVLLGMDVITTGSLHIDRKGTFQFSW